ncbi:unnamed protein product [Eruca vesicaria subsp. sativa]|uniref:Uncharacterized protein n=1 Tax=Eruca vesicaria subsp. sativa TaxID=29727 RepID=A0ABC8LTS3_ERUVS|nr:unnamed protein product [Eruca vesicaria subsp. sativa]
MNASPSSTPVSNRTVALRSTRHPRLSYSSLAPSSSDHPKREEAPVSEDEEKRKSWNLRRREAKNHQKPSGGVMVMEPSRSNRQRAIAAESNGVEVKKVNHRRLWVALSRDEIEEDVLSICGNKPSRRPRKRAKTLQKHLDVMFPGMCLVGMNADCFTVSTSPAKP